MQSISPLCWLVNYEDDHIFTDAKAVLISDTVPVMESAGSAQVCVQLDGLAGGI